MSGGAVEVRDAAGASAARLLLRETAGEAGLSATQIESLAIIASELATNQHRYAGGGHVFVRSLHRDGIAGVEIEAVDHGPGIADPTQAFAGEVRSPGSLGIGLAGVRRLALELDVDIRRGEGTRILARVFSAAVPRRPTVAVLGRPLASESVSGDCAGFWRSEAGLLVMLVDGLGHGVLAREAADRAIDVAAAAPDDQPVAIMWAGAAALRGTRGAVVATARLNNHGAPIDYASVGNIQMGVWNRGTVQRAAGHPGIVGSASQRPSRPAGLVLAPGAMFVMATDGIADVFGGLELADTLTMPPWAIAQRILTRRGKSHDDAMVVVVK